MRQPPRDLRPILLQRGERVRGEEEDGEIAAHGVMVPQMQNVTKRWRLWSFLANGGNISQIGRELSHIFPRKYDLGHSKHGFFGVK